MCSDLSHLSQEAPLNLVQLRERLRKMSDIELKEFGRASLEFCKPHQGNPPQEESVIQLEETRAEWRRRQAEKSRGSGA